MLGSDPGLLRLHQRVHVLEEAHRGLLLYRLQAVGEYGVVPLLQEVPQYRLVFGRIIPEKAGEKLVSLFEEHTSMIRRERRARRPSTEHEVWLEETAKAPS